MLRHAGEEGQDFELVVVLTHMFLWPWDCVFWDSVPAIAGLQFCACDCVPEIVYLAIFYSAIVCLRLFTCPSTTPPLPLPYCTLALLSHPAPPSRYEPF